MSCVAPQPMVAPAAMNVVIPDGLTEGATFEVMTPQGPSQLQVPAGMCGGMTMTFQMPPTVSASTAAVPMQAMPMQAMPVQARSMQVMSVQGMPVQVMPVQGMPQPVVAATTGYPIAPAPVMGTPMPAPYASFAFTPAPFTCPHCGQQGVTSVEYQPGCLTYLLCAGTAFIGCWMGCCLLPFCINEVQDATHYCPHCSRGVGVRRRIEG